MVMPGGPHDVQRAPRSQETTDAEGGMPATARTGVTLAFFTASARSPSRAQLMRPHATTETRAGHSAISTHRGQRSLDSGASDQQAKGEGLEAASPVNEPGEAESQTTDKEQHLRSGPLQHVEQSLRLVPCTRLCPGFGSFLLKWSRRKSSLRVHDLTRLT